MPGSSKWKVRPVVIVRAGTTSTHSSTRSPATFPPASIVSVAWMTSEVAAGGGSPLAERQRHPTLGGRQLRDAEPVPAGGTIGVEEPEREPAERLAHASNPLQPGEGRSGVAVEEGRSSPDGQRRFECTRIGGREERREDELLAEDGAHLRAAIRPGRCAACRDRGKLGTSDLGRVSDAPGLARGVVDLRAACGAGGVLRGRDAEAGQRGERGADARRPSRGVGVRRAPATAVLNDVAAAVELRRATRSRGRRAPRRRRSMPTSCPRAAARPRRRARAARARRASAAGAAQRVVEWEDVGRPDRAGPVLVVGVDELERVPAGTLPRRAAIRSATHCSTPLVAPTGLS